MRDFQLSIFLSFTPLWLGSVEDLAFGTDEIELQRRDLKLRREEQNQEILELKKRNLDAKLSFQKALAARDQLLIANKEKAKEVKEEV